MGFVPTGHRPIKSRHVYQAGDKFIYNRVYLMYNVNALNVVPSFSLMNLKRRYENAFIWTKQRHAHHKS
jgi:hypothetical protein